MQFQAPFDIVDMRKQRFLEQQAAQEQQQYQQQQLMKGLQQLGGAVGGYIDNKNQAAAMDKGVGMMSDLGIVDPGIRDSFMNLDRSQKPLVWDLLNKSMFAPYAAGQTAGAQARAWDQYKNNGIGSNGGNKYGYSYPGP
jgi:hypothetical protein